MRERLTQRNNPLRPRRVRAGQALVESAIAFPVLVLVAVGLVQFALFTHAQQVTIGAVQEGARLAAAEGRTLDEGVAQAQTVLRAGLGTSADAVVLHGADDGNVVVLEARGQLRTVVPWVADVLLPLKAQA